MKGSLKYALVLMGLFITVCVYGYTYQSVEFYNEGAEPCCYSNEYAGLYVAADVGYSWYNFRLHRPPVLDLFPLNKPRWRPKSWVPVVAVGYDLYPRRKIPIRFEVNFTYDDVHFSSDPLFLPPSGPGVFAHDSFRLYNTMLTLYFDWHTCTRFVPYIGVSAGYVNLDTDHDRRVHDFPIPPESSHSEHGTSFGETFGTRFFFTNHFVGNLQFRFNDLKQIIFVNDADLTLPGRREYFSDYLHERTVLFGLAYEF